MEFDDEIPGCSLGIKLRALLTSGNVITNLLITYFVHSDRHGETFPTL